MAPLVASCKDAKPCGEATERECLNSGECTLVQTEVHGKYVCRTAVGPCETGFRQGGGDYGDIKQACESKSGCEFSPPSCFCPQGLSCTCGGGPPPQCVEKKKPS
jgi:hypothetical protein